MKAKEYFKRRGTVATWWSPESKQLGYYTREMEVLKWVMKQICWNGKSVLDIGTGKGRFAIPASLNGANVYGIDISKEMLQIAKRETKKANVYVHFVLGDAEHLPFKGDQFDVIVCIATFTHLPNPQKACLQMANVLSREGIAFVQVVNKIGLESMLNLLTITRVYGFLKGVFGRKEVKNKVAWRYTVTECRKFFEETSLKIIKITGVNLFHSDMRINIIPKNLSLYLKVLLTGFWKI